MISDNIRKLLKENKLTATNLCNQIGIAQNTYYIGMRNNHFKAETLLKIASVLHVPVSEITGGTEPEKPGTKEETKKKRGRKGQASKTKVVKEKKITVAEVKEKKPRKARTVKVEKPVKPASIDTTDKEIKMLSMELLYLKQLLKAKDELIDLLKQRL